MKGLDFFHIVTADFFGALHDHAAQTFTQQLNQNKAHFVQIHRPQLASGTQHVTLGLEGRATVAAGTGAVHGDAAFKLAFHKGSACSGKVGGHIAAAILAAGHIHNAGLRIVCKHHRNGLAVQILKAHHRNRLVAGFRLTASQPPAVRSQHVAIGIAGGAHGVIGANTGRTHPFHGLTAGLAHSLLHSAEEQTVKALRLRSLFHRGLGMGGLQHVQAVEKYVVVLNAGLLTDHFQHLCGSRLKDIVQFQMCEGIPAGCRLHQNDSGMGIVVDFIIALMRREHFLRKKDRTFSGSHAKILFLHIYFLLLLRRQRILPSS